MRQVEQEGRESLLGVHAAQEQHHAVVANDFTAHDLVELLLQRGHFVRERLHLVVGNHADLRVFECHRVDLMAPGADAVQAEQLASHLESGDLVAPSRHKPTVDVLELRLRQPDRQTDFAQVATRTCRRAGRQVQRVED